MNAWFPSFNSRGDIVSGSGEIFVNEKSYGVGWRPKWIDDDHIVFAGEGNTTIVDLPSGTRHNVGMSFNDYAAGGGQWMGQHMSANPFNERFHGATSIQKVVGGGPVVMSRLGKAGYLTPYHGVEKDFIVSNVVIAHAVIMEISLCDQAAIWQVATGVHTRAVFGRKNGDAQVQLNIFNWESPTVWDGPDGPWVLSVTQKGLLFRPWASPMGYYWTGVFFNPAVLWINNEFRIASSSETGQPQLLTVPLSLPRGDLRNITDDGVNLPPPVVVIPPIVIPPPVIPPVKDPPVVATKPPNDGIEHGVVVNPKNYFLSLVWDQDPKDYANVITRIMPKLWAVGIGSQNRSSGVPSSRLFLPTVVCPDARPLDSGAKFLGVRQEEVCWRLHADTVENDAEGNPVRWGWSVSGEGTYLAIAAGEVPDVPPIVIPPVVIPPVVVPPVVVPPVVTEPGEELAGLDALFAELSAAFASIEKLKVDIAAALTTFGAIQLDVEKVTQQLDRGFEGTADLGRLLGKVKFDIKPKKS